MPLIFKILGYGGNGLMLLFGILALLGGGGFVPGAFMIGLGGLNLYLIRRIDLYSHEEVWLESEMRKRELRRQIEEFDKEEAAREASGEPKRIAAPSNDKPSQP